MDDIGGPAQFDDGFQNAFVEKNHALMVVGKEFAFVIADAVFAVKKVLVVQEINLHARLR